VAVVGESVGKWGAIVKHILVLAVFSDWALLNAVLKDLVLFPIGKHLLL
jgi:hypothetical protein